MFRKQSADDPALVKLMDDRNDLAVQISLLSEQSPGSAQLMPMLRKLGALDKAIVDRRA